MTSRQTSRSLGSALSRSGRLVSPILRSHHDHSRPNSSQSWLKSKNESKLDIKNEQNSNEKGSKSKKSAKLARFLPRQTSKIVYFGAMMGLLLFLGLQSHKCWLKFSEAPTYLSTKIKTQNEADFPAVTICPEEDRYKDDILAMHGISDRDSYNSLSASPHLWHSNSSLTPEQLFALATNEVEDLLHSVYIRTFKTDPVRKLPNFDVDPKKPQHVFFEEKRHRAFGRCYTMKPEKHVTSLGIYYYIIRAKKSLKVYLHRLGQFLDLSGRMGYKVMLGEEIQTQTAFRSIKSLDKVSEHTFIGLFTHDHEGDVCTKEPFDSCMYKALEKLMMEQVQCVAPWVIISDNSSRICTDPDKANVTFNIIYNRITNQKSDCKTPCKALEVSVGGMNKRIIKETSGRLYLYFPQRISYSEEHYFYPFLSLMGEVGGYVGLLLGVSFFHLATWLSEWMEGQQEDEED